MSEENEGTKAADQSEVVRVPSARAKRGPGGKFQAAPKPAAPQKSELEESSLAGLFHRLAAAEKGERDQKSAQAAIEDIKATLSELSDEQFRIVAGDAAFQTLYEQAAVKAGDEPGSPVYDQNGRQIGIVPFSYDWCCEHFPMEWYMPRRNNMAISWNGVTVSIWEGLKTYLPKCFIDIEEESLAAERNANREQLEVLKGSREYYADGVTLEAGWYKESPQELVERYGVER